MPNASVFADQIRKLSSFRHGLTDSALLDEFDSETEQLIRRTFGDATNYLEAYELATMGEAESIVNIPQPAQEDAVQDLPRKAIEQRRQVLEACMAELEAPPARPRPPRPARAPAPKAGKAKKAKPRAIRAKAAAKKKKKPTTAKRKRAKRR